MPKTPKDRMESTQWDDWSSDMENFDLGSEEKKQSSALSTAGKYIMAAIKGTATGTASSFSATIGRAMPNTSEFVEEIKQSVNDIKQMNEEFGREITPNVNAIRQSTLKLMPFVKGLMPTGVYNKLSDKLKSMEQPYRTAEQLKRDTRNQTIQGALGEVAGEGGTEGNTPSAYGEAKQKEQRVNSYIDRALGSVRFKSISTALQNLQYNANFQTTFLRGPYTAYIKKDLELKYRHLFVAEDTFEALRVFAKGSEAYFKRMVMYAAMPEALKSRNDPTLQAEMRSKGQPTFSSFANSYRSQLMKNIKTNSFDVLKSGISSLAMMMGMGSDMGGMYLDNGGSVGQNIVKMIFQYGPGALLGRYAGNKVLEKFRSVKDITELLTTNLKQRMIIGLENFRKKNQFTFLGDVMNSILPKFDTSTVVKNSILENPDKAVVFDNYTRQTIVEIIPKYLAKIAANTYDTASAMGYGGRSPLEVYDARKRDFVTERQLKANMTEEIFGTVENRSIHAKQAVGDFKAIQAIRGDDVKSLDFNDYKEALEMFILNSAHDLELVDAEAIKNYAYSDDDAYVPLYIRNTFDGIDEPKKVAKFLTSLLYKDIANDVKDFLFITEIDTKISSQGSNDNYRAKMAEVLETRGLRSYASDLVTSDGKLNKKTFRDIHMGKYSFEDYDPEKLKAANAYSDAAFSNYGKIYKYAEYDKNMAKFLFKAGENKPGWAKAMAAAFPALAPFLDLIPTGEDVPMPSLGGLDPTSKEYKDFVDAMAAHKDPIAYEKAKKEREERHKHQGLNILFGPTLGPVVRQWCGLPPSNPDGTNNDVNEFLMKHVGLNKDEITDKLKDQISQMFEGVIPEDITLDSVKNSIRILAKRGKAAANIVKQQATAYAQQHAPKTTSRIQQGINTVKNRYHDIFGGNVDPNSVDISYALTSDDGQPRSISEGLGLIIHHVGEGNPDKLEASIRAFLINRIPPDKLKVVQRILPGWVIRQPKLIAPFIQANVIDDAGNIDLAKSKQILSDLYQNLTDKEQVAIKLEQAKARAISTWNKVTGSVINKYNEAQKNPNVSAATNKITNAFNAARDAVNAAISSSSISEEYLQELGEDATLQDKLRAASTVAGNRLQKFKEVATQKLEQAKAGAIDTAGQIAEEVSGISTSTVFSKILEKVTHIDSLLGMRFGGYNPFGNTAFAGVPYKPVVDEEGVDPFTRLLTHLKDSDEVTHKQLGDVITGIGLLGEQQKTGFFGKFGKIVKAGASWLGKGSITLAKGYFDVLGNAVKGGFSVFNTGAKAIPGIVENIAKTVPSIAAAAGALGGAYFKTIGVGAQAISGFFGNLLKGTGYAVGGVAKGIGHALNPFAGLYAFSKKIFLNTRNRMRRETYFDVYRKDKLEPGNPLLSAKKQEEGVIFANGKTVAKTMDIDQPVFDPQDPKRALITYEDIKAGLVDIDNQPLKYTAEQFLRKKGSPGAIINNATKFTANVGIAWTKLYTTLLGKGGELALGGLASAGRFIARGLGIKTSDPFSTYHGKVTYYLASIYSILARQYGPVDGDPEKDGAPRVGSYEDYKRKKEQEKKETATVEELAEKVSTKNAEREAEKVEGAKPGTAQTKNDTKVVKDGNVVVINSTTDTNQDMEEAAIAAEGGGVLDEFGDYAWRRGVRKGLARFGKWKPVRNFMRRHKWARGAYRGLSRLLGGGAKYTNRLRALKAAGSAAGKTGILARLGAKLGLGSGAAKLGGSALKIGGKLAGKLGAKAAGLLGGPVGWAITAGLMGYDIIDGWNNAAEILGKDPKDVNWLDKGNAAVGNLLTLGLAPGIGSSIAKYTGLGALGGAVGTGVSTIGRTLNFYGSSLSKEEQRELEARAAAGDIDARLKLQANQGSWYKGLFNMSFPGMLLRATGRDNDMWNYLSNNKTVRSIGSKLGWMDKLSPREMEELRYRAEQGDPQAIEQLKANSGGFWKGVGKTLYYTSGIGLLNEGAKAVGRGASWLGKHTGFTKRYSDTELAELRDRVAMGDAEAAKELQQAEMANSKAGFWHGLGNITGLNSLVNKLGGDQRASTWQNIKDLSKYYGSKAYLGAKKLITDPGQVWQDTKDWVGEKWQGVKDWWKQPGFISKSIDWTKDAFNQTWSSVKEGFNYVKEKLSAGKEWIKDTASDVWNWSKDWASNFWGNLKDGVSKAWNGVKAFFSDPGKYFKDAWKGTKDWVSDKWQGAKDAVSNAWDSTKSWFSDKWGSVKDWASGKAKQIDEAASFAKDYDSAEAYTKAMNDQRAEAATAEWNATHGGSPAGDTVTATTGELGYRSAGYDPYNTVAPIGAAPVMTTVAAGGVVTPMAANAMNTAFSTYPTNMQSSMLPAPAEASQLNRVASVGLPAVTTSKPIVPEVLPPMEVNFQPMIDTMTTQSDAVVAMVNELNEMKQYLGDVANNTFVLNEIRDLLVKVLQGQADINAENASAAKTIQEYNPKKDIPKSVDMTPTISIQRAKKAFGK